MKSGAILMSTAGSGAASGQRAGQARTLRAASTKARIARKASM